MPPLTELLAILAVAAVACFGLCAMAGPARAGDVTLVDFRNVVDPALLKPEGATAEVRETDAGKVLRVSGPAGVTLPGVVIRAPDGAWDLTRNEALAIDVTNAGKSDLTVCCRAQGPGWNDETLKPWGGRGAEAISGLDTGSIVLAPGRSGALRVNLLRRAPGAEKTEIFGVRGSPAALRPKPDHGEGKVAEVFLFADRPDAPFAFEVTSIRAVGTYDADRAALTGETFFPFIDEFGQYIHADWPDKLHDAGDLARRRAAEQRDLDEHPGPDGWDRYGGWAAGPRLEATGFFRTQKHAGKWWLVDPEGRLFFSHGIDCVARGDTTPIDDRAAWFRDLPANDGEFAGCFGRFSWCGNLSTATTTTATTGGLAANLTAATASEDVIQQVPQRTTARPPYRAVGRATRTTGRLLAARGFFATSRFFTARGLVAARNPAATIEQAVETAE